jgi:hypothetical protein
VKTFVERPALLKSIREQLTQESDVSQPRVVGIWGSGGMGKTQLVLSYLQHYQDDYDGTFWIQAKQTASIDRDLLEIYRQLPRTASIAQTPEDVRQEVLTWFAATPGKWLLVFDGADQLDKSDKDCVDLSQYIPRCRAAHIVITSRIAAVGKLSTFEGVQVGQLERPQAAMLLYQCTGLEKRDQKAEVQVNEITHELGYLALAISIAGTYICQTPRLLSDLSRYLEEYRRRRHDVLAKQPDELVDKYGHSVMTVWETSYSAVEEQLPQACQLLTLLAFIDYEDIFLGLFGLESASDAAPAKMSWMSIWNDGQLDLNRLERCFTILERYSLIQRQTNNAWYTMHSLVQAWDHDQLLLDKPRMRVFCVAAFQMVFKAMLTCADLPESKLRPLPHLRSSVDNVIQSGVDPGMDDIELIDKIEHMGSFATDMGSWKEAGIMKKEVLEKRQMMLGDEHPDTISAMNNLANTLSDQDKLDEAVRMSQNALEMSERALGTDHPTTILIRSNVSILSSMLSKPGKTTRIPARWKPRIASIFDNMRCSGLPACNTCGMRHAWSKCTEHDSHRTRRCF